MVTEAQRKWRSENRERIADYNRKRRKVIRESTKRWRIRNPDKVRAYRIKWVAANPDKVRATKRKSAYGIVQSDFDRLFTGQGERCRICSATEPKGRGWAVDHDHASNKVRGILCNPCNLALGLFKDDPARVDAAASYLRERQ